MIPAMTASPRRTASWRVASPAIFALALGLVVGPFLSNAFGWQITSGAALAQARASLVEQQSAYCDQQARADIAGQYDALDWRQRNDLASKWAMMPGSDTLEFDVVRVCAQKLARR